MKMRHAIAIALVAVMTCGAGLSVAKEAEKCGGKCDKAKAEKVVCKCGKEDCAKCKAAAAAKGSGCRKAKKAKGGCGGCGK